jgi:hypothetical protein
MSTHLNFALSQHQLPIKSNNADEDKINIFSFQNLVSNSPGT